MASGFSLITCTSNGRHPDLDRSSYPSDRMYPGTWAAKNPDKPALVMAGSGRTLTYGQLDERSIRLARHLHDAGLRRGDVVALLSDNTPETYEVYWAALRSGLYITAVNHNLSADEASYIVRDCGARALVVSAAKAEVVARPRRRGADPARLRRRRRGVRRLRDGPRRLLGRAARRAAARRRPALLLRHHRATQGHQAAAAGRSPSTSPATSTCRSSAPSTASTRTPSTSRRRRSTTRRRCASAA